MTPHIRHILCPVDFSSTSLHALDYGAGLATSLGARLTILHAYELPTYVAPEGAFAPNLGWVEEIRTNAERELNRLVDRITSHGISAAAELREGTPFREISRAATELDADLVVMGTHGRTGLSHLLMGSVAERVVRLSPVPVLTVRHHDSAPADNEDA